MVVASKIKDTARLQTIIKCDEGIVHHFHCNNKNCEMLSCKKLQLVNNHRLNCRSGSGCEICRQFYALLSYHSKYCSTDNICNVPYCKQFKELRRKS